MLQNAVAWHVTSSSSQSHGEIVWAAHGLREAGQSRFPHVDVSLARRPFTATVRSACVGRTLPFSMLAVAAVMSRHSRRRLSQSLRPHQVAVMRAASDQDSSGPSAVENLDAISMALEFAVQTKQIEEAERLRKRLSEAEAENPVAAILWRQQKQVRTALEDALYKPELEAEARVQAINSLMQLAMPPAPVPEAEDALHLVLKDAVGDDSESVRSVAESALWSCWLKSGDEDLDKILEKGVALMESGKSQEAVDCFTGLISEEPRFAEAWNKRATALYGLKEYDRSIEDCEKVLELKPRHFGCLSGVAMCHIGRNDEEAAFQWFKKALDVHPSMPGAQKFVLNKIAQERLNPMLVETVTAMGKGSNPVVETQNGIACTWDVHRVKQEDDAEVQARIYFFRIDVRNESTEAASLQSLARFYVLRFQNGEVFPFMRLTEGAAGFKLKRGETYRYCWALIVSKELHGMAGGVLMEEKGADSADETGEQSEDERYPRCAMDPLLLPHLSDQVSMAQVQDLGQGYYYTGQLDLRGKGTSA